MNEYLSKSNQNLIHYKSKRRWKDRCIVVCGKRRDKPTVSKRLGI